MQRTEFLTKKLSQIIAEQLPQSYKVRSHRAGGVISVGREEVAKIEVVSKEEVVFSWSLDLPEELKNRLDKTAIETEFKALSKPREPTRWS